MSRLTRDMQIGQHIGACVSHSSKPQQKHLCGVLQHCKLPEAEQLSCVRDVGSARALRPGTIAQSHT
jgi:hypothetical protein